MSVQLKIGSKAAMWNGLLKTQMSPQRHPAASGKPLAWHHRGIEPQIMITFHQETGVSAKRVLATASNKATFDSGSFSS